MTPDQTRTHDAEGPHGGHSSVTTYLRIFRRRFPVFLITVLAVLGAAIAATVREDNLYQSSAQVLLREQELAEALGETSGFQDPERMVETQAEIARLPRVANRALRLTDRSERARWLLGRLEVVSSDTSNVLRFRVQHEDPQLASRLADAYAQAYVDYRREIDTRAIRQARADLEPQIQRLEGEPDRADLYESLRDRDQQLATLEALQRSNASVVASGSEAHRIRPRPVLNIGVGLAVGLILGVGLAFLREATDTRIRTVENVLEQLDLPLLGAIPRFTRALQRERLVGLGAPSTPHAESYRMLRVNYDFVNLRWGARTVVVTSATQGEGKSTTVSNLALAHARSGKRVLLVDLDLRRPALDRIFDLEGKAGLVDFMLHSADFSDVVYTVDVGEETGRNGGFLQVIPSGTPLGGAYDTPGAEVLRRIRDELGETYDIMLADSPPLTTVGDALAMTGAAEGVLIVARLGVVSRPQLRAAARSLERSPASTMGVVVVGVESDDSYGYVADYGYYHPADGAATPRGSVARIG